ncbi:MAG: dynamin family protein [Bryobacteraceae bacterium]
MPASETLDVIRWYDREIQSFFDRHLDAEKSRAFSKERDTLAKLAETADAELAVCFLGNSGVGKSTLINAVVGSGKAVVPSGGIGPLTAHAIVVRYGSETRLRVEYQAGVQLLRTVFGLEQMFRLELGVPAGVGDDLEASEGLEEQDLVQQEAADEDAAGETTPSAHLSKRDSLRRRAQLMVTGNQDEHRGLQYLLDSLREAAGGARRWGTSPEECDAERVRGIKLALMFAKTKQPFQATDASDGDFEKRLQDHATGYLAPLIKELDLECDADVLRSGVTLVDLPGVGVTRDVHREETRRWIRERAKAVVLIVDHRGMNDSVAEVLRQCELLNSLLYSVDEPDEDPVVMVAVTRIDDVANERYKQNRSKKKAEHYDDVVREAQTRLCQQLRDSLEALWLTGDELDSSKRQVVRTLLKKLEVHPISAPEYARALAGDEEDRTFLRDTEQSGIPGFRRSLASMAQEQKLRAADRLEHETSLFRERVESTLRLIQSQCESDTRTSDEVRKLKEELDVFLAPLRKELHTRQGAYRTFLKKTIPQRIEDLVESGSLRATNQISRYLNKLGNKHWATLRASVRRGGRYSGSSEIDLPSEFALRFEEPIADAWGKEILASLRMETRDYARDCVAIVEQISAWAQERETRIPVKAMAAQRDTIKADAKKLESVGREMVKEIRDDARAQLITQVEGPIKNRCEEFVRKNHHVGTGVKARILDLYARMADEVTDVAKDPAKRILQKLFREVEKEILDAFRDHQDPVEALANAIVTSQESHLKRSDAQKRRKVLEEVENALSRAPGTNLLTSAAGAGRHV